MKKNKYSIIFTIISLILFLIIIIVLSAADISTIWKSWGVQDDGSIIFPDSGNYLLLLLFKFNLYFLVPFGIAIGRLLDDKKLKKRKIGYWLLWTLNYWFLFILVLKLLADSIFELDRIFGLTLFNSVKDIQTFIGFLITFILKKNYKFEPGLIDDNKINY